MHVCMCQCLCMFACMSVHGLACTSVSVRVCTHVNAFKCMCISCCMLLLTDLHTCTCLCMNLSVGASVCVSARVLVSLHDTCQCPCMDLHACQWPCTFARAQICTCCCLQVSVRESACATRVTLRGCTRVCTPVSAPSCSCTCAGVAPHITCVGGCCLCRAWKRARGHSHGATCLHAQAWPRPQPFARACAPPSLGHCRGVQWPCQGCRLIIARSSPGPKVLWFPSQGRFWEWEAGRKHSRVHTWLGPPIGMLRVPLLGCFGCPAGILGAPVWGTVGAGPIGVPSWDP